MSDVAVITALILERPLCVECVAIKAGTTPADVERVLATITSLLHVVRDPAGRCRACGDETAVISVERR